MLLEHLGEKLAAESTEKAIFKSLQSGLSPRDLGGNASTREMTATIIGNLNT